MGDQAHPQDSNPPSHGPDKAEPVRSRWNPKPEQILILESIFNSGMVNPPKDETVRIRKLLEKFGSVGDANVFYWFQNRRSRSRRRQRQIQASLSSDQRLVSCQTGLAGAVLGQYETSNFVPPATPATTTASFPIMTPSSSCVIGGSSPSSSSCGVLGNESTSSDGLLTYSGQMGFQEMEQSTSFSSILCPSDQTTSNFHFPSGIITVFINGVATEVPRGPIDIKAMFGQDCILCHSNGVPVAVNEFGFLMQSLQHGESYFLVSRPA